jgi:hypothetical protein
MECIITINVQSTGILVLTWFLIEPSFRDGSAPKWLLGCTPMAKFEAKKWIDVVSKTPPKKHADIIAMGVYKMHLLHPLSSPQAADFPEFRDGSAPKWISGQPALPLSMR